MFYSLTVSCPSLLYRHILYKFPNPYFRTHNAHLLVLTDSCLNRNLHSNIEARVRGDLPKQHVEICKNNTWRFTQTK